MTASGSTKILRKRLFSLWFSEPPLKTGLVFDLHALNPSGLTFWPKRLEKHPPNMPASAMPAVKMTGEAKATPTNRAPAAMTATTPQLTILPSTVAPKTIPAIHLPKTNPPTSHRTPAAKDRISTSATSRTSTASNGSSPATAKPASPPSEAATSAGTPPSTSPTAHQLNGC